MRRANTGSFWDKYGAISGMFRAAKLYEIKGANGLVEAILTSKLPRLSATGVETWPESR
jgi:hypothetical protein